MIPFPFQGSPEPSTASPTSIPAGWLTPPLLPSCPGLLPLLFVHFPLKPPIRWLDLDLGVGSRAGFSRPSKHLPFSPPPSPSPCLWFWSPWQWGGQRPKLRGFCDHPGRPPRKCPLFGVCPPAQSTISGSFSENGEMFSFMHLLACAQATLSVHRTGAHWGCPKHRRRRAPPPPMLSTLLSRLPINSPF